MTGLTSTIEMFTLQPAGVKKEDTELRSDETEDEAINDFLLLRISPYSPEKKCILQIPKTE